jgi:hypothetical protein
MASVETSPEVRAALNRLAKRYAAMAPGCEEPAPVTTACRFAAWGVDHPSIVHSTPPRRNSLLRKSLPGGYPCVSP